MFTNVFAAEMVVGISDKNVEMCVKRMHQEVGIDFDEGFYRSYLLYIMLSSVCCDYLKECDLKPGDELFENISSHLAGLTRAMHGSPGALSTEVMGKLLSKGRLIIAGELFGGDKHEIRPLNKPCIDKIMDMIRVFLVVAGVVGEEKCIAMCDGIVKMLSSPGSIQSGGDDSRLDFDL
jgi:hypothetical protein